MTDYKTIPCKIRKELIMEKNQKVIPAALFSVFGVVNENFKAKNFIRNGHYLRSLKLSDMSIAPDVTNTKVSQKLNQPTKSGNFLTLSLRFPEPCITGLQEIFYESKKESKKVDTLFEELCKAYHHLLFNPNSGRTKYAAGYRKRIESKNYEDVAFKVANMTTVNLKTLHICLWETKKFTVINSKGKEESDFRMKLVKVNGIDSDQLLQNELAIAAGDMMEDQCVITFRESSDCAYQTEKELNKKRKA